MKVLESLAKAPNQKVILMPLEASSVIGSLGGLAQIARRGIRWRRVGSAAVDAARADTPWFRAAGMMNVAQTAKARDLEISRPCSP